ncbi:MAG: L,D-transpeptidase, partial [Bacteroidetes bacterium]|nr:L,D-transpeptidase [Bacteroidota bacterium]
MTILLSSCISNTANDNKNTASTTTIHHVPSKPVITPVNTGYRLITAKDSIKHITKYLPDNALPILLAVNRTDSAHITELKSLIIPEKLNGNVNQYSPFPASAACLKDVRKIILFSYPAQYFGAYEYGQLVYTGQTNMGREKDTTPTGLFYTNWKAEETHSTFNDEWDLKWNFNIENKEGIGFHQYSLPGYPAS